MKKLHEQHCYAYSSIAPMNADELAKPLLQIQNWLLRSDHKAISKTFNFKHYYQTVIFVNAVVFIAQQQDHHPDISFGYNNCTVTYSTHSIDGLSMNDFICAARIDHLNT